tara:strand:- start:4372 stop:4605 length:234 start_codon:yes stop_codon:yes gene_type:complete
MLLPFHIEAANLLLSSSKYTHDFAISSITSSATYLLTHDIPKPIVDISINLLANSAMVGDYIGNLILQLYLVLIKIY